MLEDSAAWLTCDLPGALWQASGSDLTVLMGRLDALQGATSAAMVAVAAEAERRGEVAASQHASTSAWVHAHAPGVLKAGAGSIAKAAALTADPGRAPIKAAVLSGRISPRVAVSVAREFDRLADRLVPGVEDAVYEGLIQMGQWEGVKGVRQVRPALLARHGLGEELDRDQERAASKAHLSAPVRAEDGLFEYRMVLDPEAMAALEAALEPLSAPAPQPCPGSEPGGGSGDGPGGDPDKNGWLGGPGTVRDTRPVGRRRAEALIELVRRAVESGDRVPAGVKSALLVTMDLDALHARLHPTNTTGPGAGFGSCTETGSCSGTGAGMTLGSLATGEHLAPETVRKIACDARVIPAVLGSDGVPLELGRAARLFTPAQVNALYLRDGGCTFPGCDRPARWCHAHHLHHWLDGGPTDLDNATLLCQRHHTIAHRDQIIGYVDGPTVRWDTTPGSYTHWLTRWGQQQREAARQAPRDGPREREGPREQPRGHGPPGQRAS